MSIIYVLIPIAVVLTALGLYLFFWAVKTEQFDDLEKQGLSILFDEKDNHKSKEAASQKATINNDKSEQDPENNVKGH